MFHVMFSTTRMPHIQDSVPNSVSCLHMNSISHNLITKASPKYTTGSAMSGRVGLEWFLRAKIHKSIAAFSLLQ